MKRGQGLSLTVIIVAAIALIVLVVLVAIFTGRLGIFSRGIQSCADKTDLTSGYCQAEASACKKGMNTNEPDKLYAPLLGTDCGKGQYCCIPI